MNERINANAYSLLAQKIRTHELLLTRRQILISEQADLLIGYTEVFQGTLLQDLLGIQQQLVNLNTINYSQTE